jgi:integrase/recombinase XerD
LLGYLRRLSAAPQAPAAVPAEPAEALLDRYRRYLLAEHGLGTETTADYAARVRPFLAGLMETRGTGLRGPTAADVTAFVVAACPSMRKGHGEADGDWAAVAAGLATRRGRDSRAAGWLVPSVAA